MDNAISEQLKDERKRRRAACAGGDAPAPTKVPVISLRRFFEGTDEGKAAVAKEWDDACSNVGFLMVVDHGVPADVIETMWSETSTFFDRPLEEKRAVPTSKEYPYGYSGLGGENLQASLDKDAKNPGDVKEMFNICLGGREPAPDLPPPQWPPSSTVMQAAWSAYYRELSSLAATLYKVSALALGLREDWFDAKITRHRDVIRAINYPEQQTPPLPGQVRASTHTDYGSLTILRLGGEYSGGLQVMGSAGEWVDIDPQGADAFVINLGDLMARWTNDRWLSTPHRVINPPSESAAKARRQSIAYFCNINMDADVACIPTCEGARAKYGVIAAGDHLMRKHLQTVSGQACYQRVEAPVKAARAE